ncbi:MAG: NADH-quinone oxidoreductase subunit C [Myxococcales bacterium]|nr:NADH-quinone oxidoreductase subunit C [Myxococcales bacterium]
MSKSDIKKLGRKFRKVVLDTSERLGMDTALIDKDAVREILEYLRDEEKMQYNMLRHLTCVDYLHRDPRFEVVYVLYSMSNKTQVVIKAAVPEDDPTIDSVHDLFGCANWAEREVWDMYGVDFKGHPDLRRILMYEEFDGHPLRKDYDKQASQPRVELRKTERDAIEEFKTFHKQQPEQGSRS